MLRCSSVTQTAHPQGKKTDGGGKSDRKVSWVSRKGAGKLFNERTAFAVGAVSVWRKPKTLNQPQWLKKLFGCCLLLPSCHLSKEMKSQTVTHSMCKPFKTSHFSVCEILKCRCVNMCLLLCCLSTLQRLRIPLLV